MPPGTIAFPVSATTRMPTVSISPAAKTASARRKPASAVRHRRASVSPSRSTACWRPCPKSMTVPRTPIRHVSLVSLLACLLLHGTMPSSAEPAALSGRVSSFEEGAMEGVLVSAKRAGTTLTTTVVSDHEGHFSFPIGRLEPGAYALKARAVGYALDGPATAIVAKQPTPSIDLKLRKTEDLAAQLTNAEWLASFPGASEQKQPLLECMSCHTLERIARSTHNADEWVQVLHRMAGYANNTTLLHPQRRVAERNLAPERARKT